MRPNLKQCLKTFILLVAAISFFSSSVFAATDKDRSDHEQSNIDTVVAFYNAALNEKDAGKASGYLGGRYIQHNPVAQDGVEGLVGFVNYLKNQFPNNRSEIKRAFADGDHVFLHVHTKRTPEERGAAIMEIFRLEKGKIVEHWDVQQPIPEKSANDNTMF